MSISTSMDSVPTHGGMVIVGAGECGTRAAFALREKGWGGQITVIGAEEFHAYERPPLSKSTMVGDNPDPVHPYALDDFRNARIRLLRSTLASKIKPRERRIVLEDGSHLGYTNLLLAVGGTPRRLPLPSSAGLLYLRTHEDALAIRDRLQSGKDIAIIGAGLIGLELAASARTRGCSVTVIEFADRALARAVPPEVAAKVVELHQSKGVGFLWETSATAVERIDGKTLVRLSTGELLAFDAVAVGIGAVPNTELAESAGLDIANGIAVDDHLSTSAPGIFAAGDCVSFPHPLFGNTRMRLEAWRNALDQASIAAANMLGGNESYRIIPWFWSDQYDHTLQISGLPSMSTTTVERIRPDGVTVYFGLDQSGRLVSASAFGHGSSVAKDIKSAEVLMNEGINPTPAQLSDPALPLLRIRTPARASAERVRITAAEA